MRDTIIHAQRLPIHARADQFPALGSALPFIFFSLPFVFLFFFFLKYSRLLAAEMGLQGGSKRNETRKDAKIDRFLGSSGASQLGDAKLRHAPKAAWMNLSSSLRGTD